MKHAIIVLLSFFFPASWLLLAIRAKPGIAGADYVTFREMAEMKFRLEQESNSIMN
jgi:hypothetical protein